MVVDEVAFAAVADDHGDHTRLEVVLQFYTAPFLELLDFCVDLVHPDGVLRGLEVAQLEAPDGALRAVAIDLREKAEQIFILLGHCLFLCRWLRPPPRRTKG